MSPIVVASRQDLGMSNVVRQATSAATSLHDRCTISMGHALDMPRVAATFPRHLLDFLRVLLDTFTTFLRVLTSCLIIGSLDVHNYVACQFESHVLDKKEGKGKISPQIISKGFNSSK